jgi:release factor glutamine methyltransferase
MPTYKDALVINEQYAIDNAKEDSAIKVLLLHFSQMTSSELLLHLDDEMPDVQYRAFLYGVDRYIIHHIPVQHITGREYFFGYEFKVSPDVLIPRFETEELVANTLLLYDDLFNGKEVDVVDIGTGSGCLAITLDLEETNMHVTATDISDKALLIAKTNNDRLGASVTFLEGDLLEPLSGKRFDIVISNPPYIPNDEYVEDIVKDQEPHLALFGGEDGLDLYRRILQGIDANLNETFLIAFEHAFDKAREIKALIKQHLPGVTIVQKKDMQGKDRMTFAYKI